MFGKPEIGEDYIICEEGRKVFKKITPKHLKRHYLTIPEYKEKWGYFKTQPLESKEIQRIRREKTLSNGTVRNLKGKAFEFKKGHKPVYYICEQKLLFLKRICQLPKSQKFKNKQKLLASKRKRSKGQFAHEHKS